MTNLLTPPLKWPGGKAELVAYLQNAFPSDRQRLIAPFIGGGAFEFNSQYPELVIGDINPDLINFYRQLKWSGPAFIDYCAEWFGDHNSEADYMALRDMFNTEHDLMLRAALFLYLNRHGYNGLCRYSNTGNYNVPYGYHKKAPAFPRESLLQLHERLQGVPMFIGDYEALIDEAGAGDVVYADPPYLPLPGKESFTAYSSTPFTTDDHRRLASAAKAAADRGAFVAVSNHNTRLAREIYREGERYKVKVRRNIGATAESRGMVEELFVVYA